MFYCICKMVLTTNEEWWLKNHTKDCRYANCSIENTDVKVDINSVLGIKYDAVIMIKIISKLWHKPHNELLYVLTHTAINDFKNGSDITSDIDTITFLNYGINNIQPLLDFLSSQIAVDPLSDKNRIIAFHIRTLFENIKPTSSPEHKRPYFF